MDKKFGEVEITLCNPARDCSGGFKFLYMITHAY